MNIEVTRSKSQAEQTLEDQFRQLVENTGAQPIAAARQAGIEAFIKAGLPNRRVEAWKYTDLRRHMKQAYDRPGAAPDISSKQMEHLLGSFSEIEACRIVLVNGELDLEHSDMAALGDVDVMSLSQAIENPPEWLPGNYFDGNNEDADAVIAINQALMNAGLLLNIKTPALEADHARPIMIVHAVGEPSGRPASIINRNLIRAGKGAKRTVIEVFLSLDDGPVQHNCVTFVQVEEGAELHHLKYLGLNKASTHLSSWIVHLSAKVTYDAFQFTTGAQLARNQAQVKMQGEHSRVNISGTVMLSGEQHCDTTLVIDHMVPNCASNELFKVVLDEKSRGVFQGKVIVRPDAQKTDGRQMCQAMLLSGQAEFDVKPELKIYADDVQCAHGATTGEIDEELLFYLTSRGIPEDRARAMLTTAFVAEAFEEIADETLRELFMEIANRWLKVEPEEVSNG
jgi:Fe-S cluster assembly protein SufD